MTNDTETTMTTTTTIPTNATRATVMQNSSGEWGCYYQVPEQGAAAGSWKHEFLTCKSKTDARRVAREHNNR